MENQLWNILLVEDDEDDYILTRFLLTEAKGNSFDLDWATTLKNAQEMLSQKDYDVILIDYLLGLQNGLDLVRDLSNKGNRTPTIVLTGQGSYELDLRAMKEGATDYLTKGEVTSVLLERTIRYAIERKHNEEELLKKAAQIDLQHHLMQLREQERLQIAQDLHDGPLQALIGFSFKLKEIESVIPGGESGHDQIEAINKQLRQQIQDLRNFCSELRPPTLVPFGLEKAIRSHIDHFIELHHEFKVVLDLDHDRQSLPRPVLISLFRIYQEALNNILRHAQASEISIRFHLEEGSASLEIQDNGKGFVVPEGWVQLARLGHLGLVGMRERIEAVGGNLIIQSRIGEGTLICAKVPYMPFIQEDPIQKKAEVSPQV